MFIVNFGLGILQVDEMKLTPDTTFNVNTHEVF
jgi:hypothetical protein